MMKNKAKLVADVMGHVPKKNLRFVYFFLKHGGSVDATVEWKSLDNRLSQREA